MLELAAQEQCARARHRAPLDLALEQLPERPDRSLGRLEEHVAGEAVGGNHVELPGEHVLSFDVPGETDAALRLPQRRRRRARQIGALPFLLAIGDDPHAWSGDAEHPARVDLAQQGELHELQRSHLDVRAHVDEHRPAYRAERRQEPSDARPVDVTEPAEHEQAAGEDRAGISRRDHPGRVPRFAQLEGDADRAVLLLAQCASGMLVHLHHLRGMVDAQLLCAGAVPTQLVADALFVADEDDLEAALAMRAERAFHGRGGSEIAAHRVECDQSSLPFMTALPWYSPHFGQARCGRIGSPHFGHAPTFGAVAFQCARR